VAAFGATTAAMLPGLMAHLALVREAERERVRDRWVRAWCRALLASFGMRAIVDGAPSPAPGGRLVVSNHRSSADILLLLSTFGGAMVSRADVAGWPLIGAAARTAGTVFVDRSDAFSGASAVRSIRARLVARSTVVVFPEGGTFPGDEVRPFRPGAFVASLRAGAEIVPVGLAYATGSEAAYGDETFGAHLARLAAADPSRVAVCVGAPILAGESDRAADVRDRCHARVVDLVARARGIVDA
jgi:1-acyl-sn-glycerol-3-phosphate acyltransferase